MAIVILAFEHGFGKYIAIGGSVPMLSFCYVILAAMNEKNREHALILGLLVGAISDLALGHGFGTYSLVFGFVAWETASLCDNILSSRFLFLTINTFIMTIFAQCIYFLFHIIEIGAGAFSAGFFGIIIPTALYNTVITMIFYKPMNRFFRERR
jgi:rod shape-determining protein MreD